MSNDRKPNRYRLAPRDRTGWIFGLSGVQCCLAGGGVLTAGFLVNSGIDILIAAMPLVIALSLAFARWSGTAATEHLTTHLRWLAILLFHLDRWDHQNPSDEGLPSFLRGFEVREVPAPV